VLNPPRPARLGRLRREPRRDALSTLEAAALVLRHAEAAPAAADALLAAIDRLIAAHNAPPHPRARSARPGEPRGAASRRSPGQARP